MPVAHRLLLAGRVGDLVPRFGAGKELREIGLVRALARRHPSRIFQRGWPALRESGAELFDVRLLLGREHLDSSALTRGRAAIDAVAYPTVEVVSRPVVQIGRR